jgi:hypothetical protein
MLGTLPAIRSRERLATRHLVARRERGYQFPGQAPLAGKAKSHNSPGDSAAKALATADAATESAAHFQQRLIQHPVIGLKDRLSAVKPAIEEAPGALPRRTPLDRPGSPINEFLQ